MAIQTDWNPILYTALFTAFFGMLSTAIYQSVQNWFAKRNKIKLILATIEQLSQLVDVLKETSPNAFFDMKVTRELGNNLSRAENLGIDLAQSDYAISKTLLEKVRKIFRVITDIDLLETYPLIGITSNGGLININDLSKELRDIKLSLLEKDIVLKQNNGQAGWIPENIGARSAKTAKQVEAVNDLMSDFQRLFNDVATRNNENIQRRRDLLGKLTDISTDLTEVKRTIKDKYKNITL